MKLTNLPNAPLEEMDAILIKDTKALECILDHNSRYAMTAAGPNGAFNVWKDVDDYYRGELMQHYATKDEIVTQDFEELVKKVEQWFEEVK